MKRRDVVKLIAVAPASGAVLSVHSGLANAAAPTEPVAKNVGKASAGASGSGEVPDFAGDMLTTDMQGLGPDGKPTGIKATFTGASMANATAEESAKNQMKLTREEQAMLDRMIEAYYDAMRSRDSEALEACCAAAVFPWSYALLGDTDRALDALVDLVAIDPGYGNEWQTSLWSPMWDGYRTDPRFVEALRHLNLEGVEPRRAPPGS